jgi:uncharacterized protein
MRLRLITTVLAACLGLAPYHAHAQDCQNPTRADMKAICGNSVLRGAEQKRLLIYGRIAAAMPADERAAFAAFENGWVNARNGRCPPRGGEADRTCLRELIEDHVAELETLEGKSNEGMGRLRFRSRKRAEVNPNVDIHATYAEFDSPRTPAERLFNAHVTKLVNRLPFSEPVDPRTTSTWQDTIDIRAVYLSPRLVASSFAQWVCCGAHGSGGVYTVNIDSAAGTVLVPDRWFRLDEVAAACWYQFVEGEKGGETFRQIYPLRDAIERFSEALRRPAIWSFSRRGVDLQFSALMGYAGGPYTCRLPYPDLAKTALPGVQLPP